MNRSRGLLLLQVSRTYTTGSQFTHIDKQKNAPMMVDVSSKRVTARTATARSLIAVPDSLMNALKSSNTNELNGPKGPIFATAIVAGVMAAKKTSELIPFCHPIPLEDCNITIKPMTNETSKLEIHCRVKVTGKTGVEMEALTGASVAALCVYDMCKALSHEILIEQTCLLEKTGGKSNYTKYPVSSTV